MSRQVSSHLIQSETRLMDVLVEIPQSVATRLSQQTGASLKEVISGAGVVFSVRPSQLDQLANDPQVTDIALDATVRGQMAVTTQATGANQVWKGTGGPFSGTTGWGIGIAVID